MRSCCLNYPRALRQATDGPGRSGDGVTPPRVWRQPGRHMAHGTAHSLNFTLWAAEAALLSDLPSGLARSPSRLAPPFSGPTSPNRNPGISFTSCTRAVRCRLCWGAPPAGEATVNPHALRQLSTHASVCVFTPASHVVLLPHKERQRRDRWL